ncbi:MAG: cupin domain-containing protein [Cyanobacteria bacterium P01_A01_bin.83]
MKIANLNQLPQQTVSHNPKIKKQVMLSQGDIPHLTNFSQATFAPGQTAAAHAHQDMSEVFFVSSGNGLIRINEQEYHLFPGVCVSVEPGEVHEVFNSGEEDLILTYFGIEN